MEWMNLTDVCRPKQWKTVAMKNLKNDGYPVYGANGIIGYYDKYTHKDPTVMITCRGATCGTVNKSSGKSYINGNAMALDDLNVNLVAKDYIYYYLLSYDFNKIISGSAQPQITRTNLSKVKIPVPPLATQEQIVEVLDRAQELIDKRRAQIQAMDSLIESIFYSMFGDPVRNEKGWEVKELGNVAEINPKKSDVSELKDTDKEVSFIPMTDVGEDGKLNLNEKRKISEVYKGYTYFKENDILFAKITPCMENGKSCIAKDLVNEIGFGSSEYHVIRVGPTLKKEYIFRLIRTKEFKKEAESKMTGSAGQKRVPVAFIKKYITQIPPLDLQNEFAQKVELIEREKEVLEESLELLEENYRSIMDRAFKGELFN